MSDTSRSAMLAAIQLAKAKMSQARDEAMTANSGGTTPSIPSTPREQLPAPDFVNFAEPSLLRQQERLTTLPVSLQQRSHFIDTWAAKIESFAYDNSRVTLETPKELHALDRKTLHQLAEHFNLSHQSVTVNGERRLVLRKDALFFSKAVTRPSDQRLAQLKDSVPSHRQRHGESSEVVPEKEKYADKAAYKALRKFSKATDAYANAVDTAYQIEDEIAHEKKTDHGVTRSDDHAMDVGWAAAFTEQAGKATADDSETMKSITAAAARGDLYEVCTQCGNRLAVAYDPTRWECIGPCDACGRDTLWRLETHTGSAFDTSQFRSQTAVKRPREEERADEERPTKLSVEEIVNLAKLHSFPDLEVTWIEAFAASRERAGKSDDHVLFCADLRDFLKYLPVPDGTVSLYFASVRQPSDDTVAAECTQRFLLATDRRGKAAVSRTGDSDTGSPTTVIRDVYVAYPAVDLATEEGGGRVSLIVALYADSTLLDPISLRLAASDVNDSYPVVVVQCGEHLEDVIPDPSKDSV